MPRNKPQPKPASHRQQSTQPPTVSARWLLAAIAVVVPAAAFCAWAVLCLLFWQGSWQLLYHPSSAITRTPAAIGLPFGPEDSGPLTPARPNSRAGGFPPTQPATQCFTSTAQTATSATPSATSPSSTPPTSTSSHSTIAAMVKVCSPPQRIQLASGRRFRAPLPNRNPPHRSPLDRSVGSGLGANLALQLAAAHPELAGVVLDAPLESPVNVIFSDPRARLVPARLLVNDRFDSTTPAASLRIPSLWLFRNSPSTQTASPQASGAFEKMTARKVQLRLPPEPDSDRVFQNAISRWLDELNKTQSK